MTSSTHLREFKTDELILSESETRAILKFFWPEEPTRTRIDDALVVNDRVRAFAQGLLVEAIDASYSIGFIEKIFRASANPTRGAVKVFKDFAKNAAKHWLKNTQASDLQDVRIYEFVRKQISRSFRVMLHDHLNGIAELDQKRPLVAFLSYPERPFMAKVWG